MWFGLGEPKCRTKMPVNRDSHLGEIAIWFGLGQPAGLTCVDGQKQVHTIAIFVRRVFGEPLQRKACRDR